MANAANVRATSMSNLRTLLVLMLLLASANIASAHRLTLPGEIEIKLFFTNPNLPGFKDDCGAGEFVKRKVPATTRIADAALKSLFAGPTAAEKAKGMQDTGLPGDYYLGVTIKKGVAIVNFRHGAEAFLHVSGPTCYQATILAPITQTLKQFSAIKVEYAIDGRIIKDWDA